MSAQVLQNVGYLQILFFFLQILLFSAKSVLHFLLTFQTFSAIQTTTQISFDKNGHYDRGLDLTLILLLDQRTGFRTSADGGIDVFWVEEQLPGLRFDVQLLSAPVRKTITHGN